MIVRYRMLSTGTLANFQTDIHNIIAGNVNTVNDLSAGADKTNSAIYGTYPTTYYAIQNAGTYTYSKTHSDYGTYTHYFRLSFDSTQLTGITLAQNYTSGTDTLVNSQALTDEKEGCSFYGTINNGTVDVNSIYRGTTSIGQRIENQSLSRTDVVNTPAGLRTTAQNTGSAGSTGNFTLNKYVSVWQGAGNIEYVSYNESSSVNIQRYGFNSLDAPSGLDIVITNKCLMFLSQISNTAIGIVDIGKNGVTRSFTNSMLMCSVDLNARLAKIPYSYKYTTLSYGTMVDSILMRFEPTKKLLANNTVALIENPVLLQHPETLNNVSTLYGIYSIIPNLYANNTIYTDGSVYRITANNFAILGT